MDAFRSERPLWFKLEPGEVPPIVLYTNEPHLVVWSSIWKDHPDVRIRFEIEPSGHGSSVIWTLLEATDPLSSQERKRLGNRLDQLIDQQLRATFHA